MGTRARMGMGLTAALVFGLLATFPSPASAADEDYADKDFGLRFGSAFVRFRDVLTAGGSRHRAIAFLPIDSD